MINPPEILINDAPQDSKYSCFLIDDDPEEFEIFQMALSWLPMKIYSENFLSPGIAIREWNKCGKIPSHIFMDLNIPGIVMKEELSKLQDAFPNPFTEIIIYSFPCSQVTIQLITGSGDLRCMEKQPTVDELALAFKRIFI